MLNEKFWNPEKNSYISSCIKEFIAGEPALAKLDSVKLGELETKLFALLRKSRSRYTVKWTKNICARMYPIKPRNGAVKRESLSVLCFRLTR